MKLYSYFRSSAAYRVRIALNLKKLSYETEPVHLVKNEQLLESYRAINPSQLVPTLIDGAYTFSQSISILEYLEEQYNSTFTTKRRYRTRQSSCFCSIDCL